MRFDRTVSAREIRCRSILMLFLVDSASNGKGNMCVRPKGATTAVIAEKAKQNTITMQNVAIPNLDHVIVSLLFPLFLCDMRSFCVSHTHRIDWMIIITDLNIVAVCVAVGLPLANLSMWKLRTKTNAIVIVTVHDWSSWIRKHFVYSWSRSRSSS